MDDDLHGLLAAENVAHVRLLALKALVDAEEVADLAGHMGGQLGDIGIEVVGRILKGMAMIFSSCEPPSSMLMTPMGKQRTRLSGRMLSLHSTSTSSGSPSSAHVRG